MERQLANLLILQLLENIIIKHPDLRFGQILCNYILSTCQSEIGSPHIDDPFYEESWITLNRLKKKYDNRRSD